MPPGTRSGLLVGTFSYGFPKESYARPRALRFGVQQDRGLQARYLNTFLGGLTVPANEKPLLGADGLELVQEFLGYELPAGKYQLASLEGPAWESCTTIFSKTPMESRVRLHVILDTPVEFEIRAGEVTYLGQLHVEMDMPTGGKTCAAWGGGLIGLAAGTYTPRTRITRLVRRAADVQRMQVRFPKIAPTTPGYPVDAVDAMPKQRAKHKLC